jgi:hypothetical protein
MYVRCARACATNYVVIIRENVIMIYTYFQLGSASVPERYMTWWYDNDKVIALRATKLSHISAFSDPIYFEKRTAQMKRNVA